jgi:hypothetical protein
MISSRPEQPSYLAMLNILESVLSTEPVPSDSRDSMPMNSHQFPQFSNSVQKESHGIRRNSVQFRVGCGCAQGEEQLSLADCDIRNSRSCYPEKLEESSIQCNNLWGNRLNLVQNVLLDAAVFITLANDVSISLACHSRLLVYTIRCGTLWVRGVA